MKNYRYKTFGLNIDSEVELPELLACDFANTDVWIKIDFVPNHIPNPFGKGVLYEASYNDFLIKLDSIAKYRIQNGNLITIEPSKKSTPEEIRLFLLGSAIGALLLQKGSLPIHGSTVYRNNQLFLITGESAVGKSSLAAGLIKLGYSLVADDLSVIYFRKDNSLSVQKGIPHLKLWSDILSHLNESKNLDRVRPQLEKYKKPIPIDFNPEMATLNKIIVITTKNTLGFKHSEIFGAERFEILRNQTYRIQFIEKMNRTSEHFINISGLAKSTRLFHVERPYVPLNLMDFAKYINNQIFFE